MTKQKKMRVALLACSVACVMLAGVLSNLNAFADAKSKTLKLEGSTTVGPIADAFAAYFRSHRGAEISIKKTGSGDGAAALIDNRCDIANMSRFMKGKEFKKAVENGVMPVAHVVAMDGVCPVVHPSNPVKALTLQQIRDIYTGKISNWKELGGADSKITIISRDTASGTYETFHKIAMKKKKMKAGVEYVSSNTQAFNRVKTTRSAIGYVGLGFLTKEVKALDIEGITPTKRTIAAGVFPISRPLYMFTNGYPKLGSLTHAFVTFHLSEKGQEIIEAKGFVPVTDY